MVKPNKDNKYYLLISQGGYNPCLDVTTQKDHNGVLDPDFKGAGNCVWWAVGRFNELANAQGCKWLGNTNAKNMVVLAKRQGLTVSQVPQVGACAVWDDGKYGHVEIVESVSADGKTIFDSSSAYATYVLADKTRKKDVGGIAQWGWKKPTKFLGFILQPPKPKKELVGELVLDGVKYQVTLKEV